MLLKLVFTSKRFVKVSPRLFNGYVDTPVYGLVQAIVYYGPIWTKAEMADSLVLEEWSHKKKSI